MFRIYALPAETFAPLFARDVDAGFVHAFRC